MSGSLGDAYADAHLDLDSLDFDIDAARARLETAVRQWEQILKVSGEIQLDTGRASTELEGVVRRWETTLARSLVATVDLDADGATGDLATAVVAWRAAVDAPLVAVVDIDTDGATTDLAAAAVEWRTLTQGLVARIGIDADGATGELLLAQSQWQALIERGIVASVDMDTSSATAHLEAWIEETKAILAGSLSAVVDADTAQATADIIEAATGWERSANVDGGVDLDLLGATAALEAAVAEWKAMASFTATVRMNIEDEESLANLATTFAGIKPLLDLPVRFHLDGGSVGAATDEIVAIADRWESILNLNTRIRPTGENELPDRPIGDGNPAQPRGPNIGDDDEPVITPRVDPGPAAAEARQLRRIIDGLLTIVVPVDLNDSGALADAEALAPLIQNLLKVTSEVDLSGEAGALASAEALSDLLNEALKITATVDVDSPGAVAKAEAIRTLLNGVLRDLVLKMTVDGDAAGPQAVAMRAAIEAALGTISAKVDLDKTKALAEGALLHRELKAIAGTLKVDVDIDSASARGKLIGGNFARDVKAGFKNVIPELGGSVLSLLGFGDGGGRGDGLTSVFNKAATAGGVLSGVMNELGSVGETLSTTFSKVGSVGGTALSGLGSMAVTAAGLLFKLVGILALVGLALTTITGAAAAASAAIGSVAAAAGGLIGIAGGFATIAGGLGLAAAAAGALGIALNKDLLGQVKDGLATLKSSVAAVTRDAGQEILDKFQRPFINAFTRIAAGAAKLTSALVDPIAEAGLRYLSVAEDIINSDVGARITAKLGEGIAGFIDQFAGYLPAYADLVDRLLGQTSGIHDFVEAILELGLQAEPLFVSLGNLLSGISSSVLAFGATGIPIITRIVDSLTGLLTSDLFVQFNALGAVALNGLLDIVSQIADGMKSAGLADIFNTIGQAVLQLVDSGIFERLGEILGALLDMGAGLLGPINNLIITAADALISFLEPLIPVIESFVTVLADQLGKVINQWVQDGVFEKLGNAAGEFLAILTLGLPIIAELVANLGGPLADLLDVIVTLFQAVYVTAGALGNAILKIGGIAGEVAGWVIDKLTDLARTLVDAFAWALPESVSQQLRDGLTTIEQTGVIAGISGYAIENQFAPAVLDLGLSYGLMGSAADRANAALEYSNSEMELAGRLTKDYGDVLGAGVDTILQYGQAHGLTAEQMTSAADAAVDVAEQFKYTTELVDKLREELSKPITLSFDFEETKLDLDSLVSYVDTQIKTVRENAATPISTDPTTESLASAVVGADGTTLNQATSQKSTEQLVPAHLETSVADAVQEMYDNAILEIDNASYLKELRFNGFSALADQLEQFDGPKLELAIQELGDSTSAAVRSANAKIADAQKELDVNLNPIQTAIDDAKKEGILKIRQVQIVNELESRGFDDLASQIAAVKPEDLEAAIRTYDNIGGPDSPIVAEMEKQLDDLAAALESQISEIDPIGKMWAAAANTPGAQQGLIGKILTPEQIQAAIGDPMGLTGEQQGLSGLLDIVGAAIESPDGSSVPGGMSAEDVQRWKNLFNGFDPRTGKPVADPTDEEAKIIAALQLRQAQGDGKVISADGTISAGQAEATTAGASVANAFAQGMTNAEGSKVVEDAANGMIGAAVSLITASVATAAGPLVQDGLAIPKLIAGGMGVGFVLDLIPEAVKIISDMLVVIDALLRSPAGPVNSGMALIDSIVVGLNLGAVLGLYSTAVTIMAATIALTVATVEGEATRLTELGQFIPAMLATGLLLGLIPIVSSIKVMGDLMVALIEEESKRSAFAANLMGQAIGDAVGEGLRTSIARIGLDAGTGDPTGGGGLGGGKVTGSGRKLGQAATDEATSEVSGPGVNIGSAIVDGMILGMQTRLPDLIKAATDIAAMVAAVMRDTLQVKSPSKVTQDIGSQIVEGLAIGLEAGTDRVLVAASSLADRVTDTLGSISLMPDDLAPGTRGRPSFVETATTAVAGQAAGLVSLMPDELAPGTRGRPSFAEAGGIRFPNAPEVDLVGLARAAAAAATALQAPPAPTPQPTPQQASASTRAASGAYIHADQLIINGVPGAEKLPERVDEEFWRIGYGESPRRRIDP